MATEVSVRGFRQRFQGEAFGPGEGKRQEAAAPATSSWIANWPWVSH